MKTHMDSQLHNKHMRKYLIEREVWRENKFDEIDWKSYDMAFKRMGRSRQTAMPKCVTRCGTQE
jgi:hypothetical protein